MTQQRTLDTRHSTCSAFTLIELSIVLVIIGLLAGGVLGGQSLIHAAQLRSVLKEHQNYQVAISSFRDKYFSIPGDMPNATAFWGTDAKCADANAAATPGTCNGNGNGIMEHSVNPGETAELYQFWKHLALSGLIEGTYSGIRGIASDPAVTKANTPTSKLRDASWHAVLYGAISGHQGIFDRPASTGILQFGKIYNVAGSGNREPVFIPSEAWNIDQKIDDGKPAVGKFIVRINETIQTLAECTNATSTSDLAADYQLTSNAIGCAAFFMGMF